jgi:chemotaxis protein MotB
MHAIELLLTCFPIFKALILRHFRHEGYLGSGVLWRKPFNNSRNDEAMEVRERNCYWLSCLCGLVICALGCNRNPYQQSPYAAMGAGGVLQPTPQAMMGINPMAQAVAPQIVDLQRRAQLLDDTNRTLTTQLAQAQQQMQVARDRADLLAKQLQDTTGQLQQSLLAQRQTESQALGIQASINKRGGAKLTANNSIPISTNSPQIPGAHVIQDGDLIRVRIPADQLFGQGTAQIVSSGSNLLDQVATSIGGRYSRQRIAIEGHTDTGPLYGGAFSNPSQFAGAQAQAVIDHLVRRNNLPSQQLFLVAHGPNYPIGDNQTASGRADNRRIEIVIYPETF